LIKLLPCTAAACWHVSVGFTETAEQYKALTTSLQLQHEANQKAAQIMATQQALLASRQEQLDTANAAVAEATRQLAASQAQLLAAELHAGDLQQQLAAQSEELAAMRAQLAAARMQHGN
jgi:chromosome segregation ATPase